MKNNKVNKLIIWGLIASLSFNAVPVWALSKSETIYGKLDTNGNVNNVIVSEHISDNGKNIITDKSKLDNIVNVNGNETKRYENDKLIWETNGNDIYYQGNTKEELPISVNVSYYLDDKLMDVNEMIGNKGKIKIKINYTNNESKNVLVNGKNETLYTPFIVATISMIPNKGNRNISINNGKIIDNGINKMVVGISTPGMYDSLKISKLKDFDEVIISYDTDSFELSSIYSAGTSELFDDSSKDMFNDINKIYSSINELNEASGMLVKGSNDLLSGASALKDGSGKVLDGTSSAYKGSEELSNAVSKAISSLENSSNNLDSKVLEGIVNSAVKKATLDDKKKKEIGTTAVEAIKKSAEYNQINSEYLKYSKMIQEVSASYKAALSANNKEVADKLKVQLESVVQAQTMYKTMLDIMEKTAYQTSINTADIVSKTVAGEVAYNVALGVADKVMEEMSKQVVNSLKELYAGIDTLSKGLYELNVGANSLNTGIGSLYNGINELNIGINKMDKDGINKINTLVNTDLRKTQKKLEALVDLSNSYKTFDDINSDSNGNSKIIMVIDGIKNEEHKENKEAVVEEKKGIIAKIKGLFK